MSNQGTDKGWVDIMPQLDANGELVFVNRDNNMSMLSPGWDMLSETGTPGKPDKKGDDPMVPKHEVEDESIESMGEFVLAPAPKKPRRDATDDWNASADDQTWTVVCVSGGQPPVKRGVTNQEQQQASQQGVQAQGPRQMVDAKAHITLQSGTGSKGTDKPQYDYVPPHLRGGRANK